MPPIRRRLDGWLTNSPVSDRDLSLFRVIYASFVLLTLWRSDYVSSLPPVAFDPPSGPFALLNSPPSICVIWGIQVLLAISLSALVIGWRTRLAAVTTALLQIVLYGIGYSYGKVDHTIFLPLVPLLLSFSTWGSQFSVDANRAERKPVGHSWALRCLAVAIGVGLLTAGLAKVRGGWLSWDTQATFGRLFMRRDVFNAPPEDFSYLRVMDYPIVWEILDYSTVILECGIVVAALSWRMFYVGIAALATFHLFIWPTMGILFPYNLPAYAAFFPWSRLERLFPTRHMDRVAAKLASHAAWRLTACGVLAGLALLLALLRPPWLVPTVYAIVLIAAGVIGFAYLALTAVRALVALGKRSKILLEHARPSSAG